MIKTSQTIYLASKSPRRKKLLKQLNLKFKTIEIIIEEKIRDGEQPVQIVKRLSNEKLEKAKRQINDGIIITADTIVVLNNQVIGKPSNKKDALKILKKLSGKTHLVYTGFSIFNTRTNKGFFDYEKTEVTFRKLNHDEIKDYIASGRPLDKAGAYGIQDDFGAVFVEKINGCFYNVVGLPLTKVYKYLLRIL